MKYISALVLAVSMSVSAQTKSPSATKAPASEPVMPAEATKAVKWLVTPENLSISLYGLYSVDHSSTGGGIGVAAHANKFLSAGLRLDWLNWENKRDDLIQPAMCGEFGIPLRLSKNVTVKPFAMSAVAIPLAGAGDKTDTVQGLFGSGTRLSFKNVSLEAAVEKWTNVDGLFVRGGLSYKF